MTLDNSRILLLILVSFVLVGRQTPIQADVLHVPAQYTTIGDALLVAENGDVIEIADGIYSGFGNYNLNFAGKAITIQSANGPDNCIIQIDQHYTRGFVFISGETNNSILKGITFRDGYYDMNNGGAINCIGSSPIITECIFINNFAMYGGAIHLENSDAIIAHCQFIGNTADIEGTGLGAEGGGADC